MDYEGCPLHDPQSNHAEYFVEDETESMIAKLVKHEENVAEILPTETDVLLVMVACYHRLQSFGWKDMNYCPRDGTWFHSISLGSTGIGETHHDLKVRGTYWNAEAGDLWPASPVMWKPKEKS